MIGTATSLALLSTGGILAIYVKLPRKLRKIIENHALLTDFLSLLVVYTVLGGTLTALMAGAMAGLMISMALHVVNHKDDYIFIYDFMDLVSSWIEKGRQALVNLGKTYRTAHGT